LAASNSWNGFSPSPSGLTSGTSITATGELYRGLSGAPGPAGTQRRLPATGAGGIVPGGRMISPSLARRCLASGAALIALAGVASPASARPPRLLPDLKTLPMPELNVCSNPDDIDCATAEAGQTVLRLSNWIGNRGRGPMEIFPSKTSHNCDGDGDPLNDRTAYQRIYRDTNLDGRFERSKDRDSDTRVAGCMAFHHAHFHWHFNDFARYTLRSASGDVVSQGTKISFCVLDSDLAWPDLPGSPAIGYYPVGGNGCDEVATEGLSVGWSDVYGYYLAGQQLDVTGLEAGSYCLISKADPINLLVERNNWNNARRQPIALDPAAQTVTKLTGYC
jgi:hypothetical protein